MKKSESKNSEIIKLQIDSCNKATNNDIHISV